MTAVTWMKRIDEALSLCLMTSYRAILENNFQNFKISVNQCDNDPSSHKEVHKHRSEVGIQKDVY